MTTDQRIERIESHLQDTNQRLEALESKAENHSQAIEQNRIAIEQNRIAIEQNRIGIEQNRIGIERNRVGIEKNQASIESNRELLSFIIKKLDENHEEQKRHSQMLLEAFRSDLRVALDQARGNRERIDDHEERIEALESAS